MYIVQKDSLGHFGSDLLKINFTFFYFCLQLISKLNRGEHCLWISTLKIEKFDSILR